MDLREPLRVYTAELSRSSERAAKRARRDAGYARFIQEHCLQHGADAKEARPLVQQLRSWCQVGAYAVCGVCGGLEARSLNEKDLRILPECTVECCQVCTAGQYVRPQRAHVPPQLRDLTLAQVEALSPLSLHQGDYSRASAGYGKFSRFTRLRWKASTFGERRAALPEELHEGVIAAYEFLMDNED